MVCAFVRRRLGIAVNRKRVLRVLRERKLIQRRRGYVDRYHHRPHSRLGGKTPYEVKETWELTAGTRRWDVS